MPVYCLFCLFAYFTLYVLYAVAPSTFTLYVCADDPSPTVQKGRGKRKKIVAAPLFVPGTLGSIYVNGKYIKSFSILVTTEAEVKAKTSDPVQYVMNIGGACMVSAQINTWIKAMVFIIIHLYQ